MSAPLKTGKRMMQTKKMIGHLVYAPSLGTALGLLVPPFRELLETINSTPKQIVKEMKASNNADVVRYGYRMEKALFRMNKERAEAFKRDMEEHFFRFAEEQITGKPYVPPPPPPPQPIDIEKLRADVAAGEYEVKEADVYGHGCKDTYAYVVRKDDSYGVLPKRYLEAILADFAEKGATP